MASVAKAETASQPGHGHTVAQITDSTAAGRAVLTAIDAAAGRTALGLGSAATTPTTDYATAAQGVKADGASERIREVQGNPNSGDGPIITFLDDDGDPLWYDIWQPICDAQGIKMSLALKIANATGETADPSYPSITVAQALAIEAAGHDILCHSYHHYSTDATPVATLDADWALARTWMQDHFPATADVLVYPGGLATGDLTKKNAARKYFRYGIATVNSNSHNKEPFDSWLVQRINGDTLTEAQIKTKIDAAIAANGWLIVLTHDKQLDIAGRSASVTKLNNVIDYAQAAGVQILPWSQAEKIKGNALAIGEYTTPTVRKFVSHRGIQASTDLRGKFTPTIYGSTTAGTHTYATQVGYYDVVGGMAFVRVSLRINVGGWDTANCTGYLRLGGLPSPAIMSVKDSNQPAPVNFNYLNLGAGYTTVWAKWNTGNYIPLYKNGTGVYENYVNATAVDAAQVMSIDFWATWMAADDRWTVL